MIELRLLGNAELGPQPSLVALSPLNQPKRTALLAYLALARPRGFHRRDKLLGLFWPEADTRRARSALRSALYFLRQHLGDDVLVSRGDTEVGIDSTRLWCDAAAFEDAVAAKRAKEALALYRGPLLDGFFLDEAPEFERWLEEERTRLHAAAAEAAWQLSEQAEAAGDATTALKWARRAAEFSPADEAVVRRLIESMDRIGDRAAAMRAYDAFVVRLKKEYDLEPSPETSNLAESIRKRAEPAGRTPPTRPSTGVAAAAAEDNHVRPGASWGSARVVRGAWATALLVVIVLVVALRATIARDDAAAARTLIVLPFRTVGPEVETWREGMVDALATNLDGMGGLRVIEPRTALSGWTGDGERTAAPIEEVFEFAERKGARFVLTGSVLHAGNRVRIAVELHDALTHKRLNTESVEGPIDSLLVLADRISIDLLRRSILGATELRLVDASRVQTTVPGAVKAFLEGEQHWRRSQFHAAAAAYERAVQFDSAFAFAWLRLSAGCGWAGVSCSDSTIDRYRAQALRYADRLPNRDRQILTAMQLTDAQAAIDSLERFTSRYPDDAEGWFLLGERAYHAILHRTRTQPAEGLKAFRRAIELDPSFGPAYEHLIPDAFARGDSATTRRLLEQWQRTAAVGYRVIGLRLAFDLAFGTRAQREAARAALDTASIPVLQSAQLDGNMNCCASSPALWQLEMTVARARAGERHDDRARRHAHVIMAKTLMSRGRFREADSVLAPINMIRLDRGALAVILNSRVGVAADSAIMRRAAAAAAEVGLRPPHYLYAAATRALMDGNGSEAERSIIALEESGVPTGKELARALRALRAGERQNAALALEDALHSARGNLPYQLRYDLGRLWLEMGDLQRARVYFASIEMLGYVFNGPVEFYLGLVNERLGNHVQARLHYGRFVDWWQDCDPEVRPLWEEGRRALARVQPRS